MANRGGRRPAAASRASARGGAAVSRGRGRGAKALRGGRGAARAAARVRKAAPAGADAEPVLLPLRAERGTYVDLVGNGLISRFGDLRSERIVLEVLQNLSDQNWSNGVSMEGGLMDRADALPFCQMLCINQSSFSFVASCARGVETLMNLLWLPSASLSTRPLPLRSAEPPEGGTATVDLQVLRDAVTGVVEPVTAASDASLLCALHDRLEDDPSALCISQAGVVLHADTKVCDVDAALGPIRVGLPVGHIGSFGEGVKAAIALAASANERYAMLFRTKDCWRLFVYDARSAVRRYHVFDSPTQLDSDSAVDLLDGLVSDFGSLTTATSVTDKLQCRGFDGSTATAGQRLSDEFFCVVTCFFPAAIVDFDVSAISQLWQSIVLDAEATSSIASQPSLVLPSRAGRRSGPPLRLSNIAVPFSSTTRPFRGGTVTLVLWHFPRRFASLLTPPVPSTQVIRTCFSTQRGGFYLCGAHPSKLFSFPAGTADCFRGVGTLTRVGAELVFENVDVVPCMIADTKDRLTPWFMSEVALCFGEDCRPEGVDTNPAAMYRQMLVLGASAFSPSVQVSFADHLTALSLPAPSVSVAGDEDGGESGSDMDEGKSGSDDDKSGSDDDKSGSDDDKSGSSSDDDESSVAPRRSRASSDMVRLPTVEQLSRRKRQTPAASLSRKRQRTPPPSPVVSQSGRQTRARRSASTAAVAALAAAESEDAPALVAGGCAVAEDRVYANLSSYLQMFKTRGGPTLADYSAAWAALCRTEHAEERSALLALPPRASLPFLLSSPHDGHHISVRSLTDDSDAALPSFFSALVFEPRRFTPLELRTAFVGESTSLRRAAVLVNGRAFVCASYYCGNMLSALASDFQPFFQEAVRNMTAEERRAVTCVVDRKYNDVDVSSQDEGSAWFCVAVAE